MIVEGLGISEINDHEMAADAQRLTSRGGANSFKHGGTNLSAPEAVPIGKVFKLSPFASNDLWGPKTEPTLCLMDRPGLGLATTH